MDPNVFAYAQILASAGSRQFFQVPQNYQNVGGLQTSPEIETVPETQPEPEPVVEAPKRSSSKRSHKKKETSGPRRKGDYLAWEKDEEYVLAKAWLDISEPPMLIRATFFKDYRKQDSLSSKWTNINWKCHQFQEVFQRNWDNRDSDENDVNVITKALEEYTKTKGSFTYFRCCELLRGSPKWANVPTMTLAVDVKQSGQKHHRRLTRTHQPPMLTTSI
ncbi:hypothetical protein Hdeb2414_s0013g00404841 [Helianthus debilis subsp. tardiflorus]